MFKILLKYFYLVIFEMFFFFKYPHLLLQLCLHLWTFTYTITASVLLCFDLVSATDDYDVILKLPEI